MRIQIFTDNWHPQVNGIVTSIEATRRHLEEFGHEVSLVYAGMFKTLHNPFYPELRLAVFTANKVARLIEEFRPDAIHIATEGPLGWSVRAYCIKHGVPYSTSYHTRIPQYFKAYFGIPETVTYYFFRKFHRESVNVMVPTMSILNELKALDFQNLKICARGVDTTVFRPLSSPSERLFQGEGPVLMYVGRVALEKNIPAFLNLDYPGRKVVVGDGPMFSEFKEKYPHIEFVGAKFGSELALHYASADVMVFPSLTDTFGLVLLEALACGTPVAAYPVMGPADVIKSPFVGALREDLRTAVDSALKLSRERCREYALEYSWEKATRQFESLLFAEEEPVLKSTGS